MLHWKKKKEGETASKFHNRLQRNSRKQSELKTFRKTEILFSYKTHFKK